MGAACIDAPPLFALPQRVARTSYPSRESKGTTGSRQGLSGQDNFGTNSGRHA